jgi:hypothetical protein
MPRLCDFVQENGNGRFHRFVTLSDDCKADFVSESPSWSSRSLIGWSSWPCCTPDQYGSSTANDNANTTEADGATTFKTTTRSAVAAHVTLNYLQGISRVSKDHPLSIDLPPKIVNCLCKEKVTHNANET